MQRPWRFTQFWNSIRRNWRVAPCDSWPAKLSGQLLVRELEQRRVLTVSPGAIIVAPVVLAGMGEGAALSLEPGEGMDSDAPEPPQAEQQQGEEAPSATTSKTDEPTDIGSDVSTDVGDMPLAVPTTAGGDQLQPLENDQGQGLSLTVASDQSVDEGALLSVTDIGVFTDPFGGIDVEASPAGELLNGPYTFTINWGDGTPEDSGEATIDVPGSEGEPTMGSFDGSHVYADNGQYTVTVTITSELASTTDTLSVTVNNVTPNLTVAPNQTVDEGSLLSITDIGQFTDPGFDNPLNVGGETTERFTFAIDWGDGTPLDSGPATIDVPGSEENPTAGSFDGSHTYADNGIYTVTVTLSDDDGGTTSDTFLVTVNNVTPILTVAPDQTVDEGTQLSITDIGQFTDPGFDNPLNGGGETTERFTFAIDWGDGTPLDSGPATIDVPGSSESPTAGSFDGSHTYADNGIYMVTVTLSDDDGGTTSATFQVTVNNVTPTLIVPEDQVVDEGTLLSLTDIGVFTDPGFDNPLNVGGELTERFTFAIDWGDGTPLDSGPATIDTPGSKGNPTGGSFDGSHTYADNGIYTVTVTLSDDDGGTVSRTFQVTVNNVAPTLIVPEDQTVDEGTLLSLTDIGQFTDPGFDNPLNIGGETTERFTFAIDWGDGTPLDSGPATIDVPGSAENPTAGSFDGSHTYADNGTYTVTVTISDDDGGTTSATFQVLVNNVSPALIVPEDQVIDEGSLLSITDIGQFTDPGFDNPLNIGGEVTEQFTFEIDWGDGTPTDAGPATIDVPGSQENPTTGSFDGSHTYADNGIYTVTVTVSDDDGGTTSATFQVTVNNVAPTLIVPEDQTVDEGALLSITDLGQFTDPGFDNPLNIGGETTERFTFAVDWGDGTALDSGPGPIDTPGQVGVLTAGSFDGSHTYADNGTYTVTVTVSDDDGGTTSATFQVLVNNVAPALIVPEDQVVDEGSLLSISDIGRFTDPGFDNPSNPEDPTSETFTFAVDWGDGTGADTGAAPIDTPGAAGVLTAGSFDGSHIYADNGVYTVTVTVTDDDGGATEATFLVSVNNVAPSLAVPGDQTVGRNAPLELSDIGVYTDPGFDNPLNVGGETVERFTFIVDWGDGTTADAGPAAIDTPGGPGVLTAGSFDGSHVYQEGGIYTVTVTVNDDDGGSAVGTFLVYVGPTLTVGGQQVVDEGSPLVITNIGQFVDPTPLSVRPDGSGAEEPYSFTINWGDGTPLDTGSAAMAPGAGAEGEVADVAFSGAFDGAHVYADNGSYTVTVEIASPDGRVDTAMIPVTVNNVAPSLVVPGDQTVGQTRLLTLADIGQFTDPGFDNPLNVGGETTERFIYDIDWGDGTSSSTGAAGIDSPGSPGALTAGSFDGGHIYFASGQFTVTVTVSDDDGGSARGSFTVTVAPIIPQNIIFLPPGGGGGGPPERPPVIAAAARPSASGVITRSARVVHRAASVAGAEYRLVLRVVLPSGVEDRDNDEVLPNEVLDNLRGLFERLPDGHYRLYQIQPDGIERLVVDVIVRQGRNIDIADEASDVGELPPGPQQTTEPSDRPEMPAGPAVTPPPIDQTMHQNELELDDEPRIEAALALGGGYLVHSAPARRAARIARGTRRDRPRRLTKIGRMLRRAQVER